MSKKARPQLSTTYIDPQSYPVGVAYLDKQYVPISEAKLSVLDLGFLHGDATYDVLHTCDGRLFRHALHIERFFQGMQKLHLHIPYSREEVLEIIANTVALSGLREAYVEIICTRGHPLVPSRDPRDAINRFMVFAVPMSAIASDEQMARGLHLAISEQQRISPRAVDPTIKNYHWLDLVAGLFDAYAQHAESALLLDDRGNIAEGPGFNVFTVKAGHLATPDYSVLRGITRQSVIDICRANHWPCESRAISPAELIAADEVFITSTAGGIMPVTKIDGWAIGDGRPGAKTGQIKDIYWQKHRCEDWSTAIDYDSICKAQEGDQDHRA